MTNAETIAVNFPAYLARIDEDELACVCFLLGGELLKRGISGFGALFKTSEELRHRGRFEQPPGYPIFSGDCRPPTCTCPPPVRLRDDLPHLAACPRAK